MAKLYYTPTVSGTSIAKTRPVDFKHDGWFYLRAGNGRDLRVLGKSKTLENAIKQATNILKSRDYADVVISLKRLDNKPRYYGSSIYPATNVYECVGLVAVELPTGRIYWDAEKPGPYNHLLGD